MNGLLFRFVYWMRVGIFPAKKERIKKGLSYLTAIYRDVKENLCSRTSIYNHFEWSE